MNSNPDCQDGRGGSGKYQRDRKEQVGSHLDEAVRRAVASRVGDADVMVVEQREWEAFLAKLNRVNVCLLCGGAEVFARGIFQPDEPWRLSSRPPTAGKLRTYYYGLCQQCFALEDRDARCDRMIARADGGAL